MVPMWRWRLSEGGLLTDGAADSTIDKDGLFEGALYDTMDGDAVGFIDGGLDTANRDDLHWILTAEATLSVPSTGLWKVLSMVRTGWTCRRWRCESRVKDERIGCLHNFDTNRIECSNSEGWIPLPENVLRRPYWLINTACAAIPLQDRCLNLDT